MLAMGRLPLNAPGEQRSAAMGLATANEQGMFAFAQAIPCFKQPLSSSALGSNDRAVSGLGRQFQTIRFTDVGVLVFRRQFGIGLLGLGFE